MSDFVSIKAYKIATEQITSVTSYETNSQNILSASNPEAVFQGNMRFLPDFTKYEPEKLNLKIVYTFWEDPANTQELTDSVIVEEVPEDTEWKRIIFPIFIRCQNCEVNFPTKYQYQRHQCHPNIERGLKSLLLNTSRVPVDNKKVQEQKFVCNVCYKKFVSQNNLDRHKLIHEDVEENICEYCHKQFITENRLRIHQENHCKKSGDQAKFYRSDVAVWKCKRCDEVFSSQENGTYHTTTCTEVIELYDHEYNDDSTTRLVLKGQEMIVMKESNQNENRYLEKILTEILLQCEFCNRTYADKNLLLMHQRKHSTVKNYECINCSVIFDSYISASSHWLQKCSKHTNLFYLPKLTFCEYCNRTFKSHELLYSHKFKKRHYTPKLHVGVCFDKENIPPKIHTFANFTTEILNKFDADIQNKLNEAEKNVIGLEQGQDQPENLSLKIKSEPTSENGSCTDLDVSNPRENKTKNIIPERNPSQEIPIAPTIMEEFKYQCQMCIKVFSSIKSLDNHRSSEHAANFRCDDCGQILATVRALLSHSRAHKSLKPYVCDTCGRSYSQTSHLWQHMRFHQGIKPFACPHEGCEARYTIRPDLKDHIRKAHTRERPFKCSVCNKCFLTGSVYYQHRLIHTNDRRYGCDICEKRFFRADALNNHKRIHTDERPYSCEVCGRDFRQRGDMNKHIRTQHPGFMLSKKK